MPQQEQGRACCSVFVLLSVKLGEFSVTESSWLTLRRQVAGGPSEQLSLSCCASKQAGHMHWTTAAA